MISHEQQLCERLEKASRFENDGDFDEFIEVCQSLPITSDYEVLRRMIRCIDQRELGEVQFELVEACERFSDEVYVPIFLEEATELYKRAGRWFWLMFQSVLNSKSCLEVAINVFRKANVEQRQEITSLLEELVSRDQRYRPLRESFKKVG